LKNKKININKILLSIIITLFLTFVYIGNVFADVGSFESYDSGSSSSDWSSSSWSSSDWGSSSSWSSSSWDGDSSSGDFGIIDIVWLIIVITIIVVNVLTKTNRKNIQYTYTPPRPNSKNVLKQIQEVDPLFSEEEFIAWSKDLFVKLQNQWMAREWEEIRYFETNELFEQHKKQIQGYIDKKQINMLERICVNYAELYGFKQVGDKDILEIALNSSMVDYIIDEDTKKVLMGDKTTRRTRTYKLTFIRKTGIKTKPGESKVNTTNCPNCGAPTQITSSGKCEYCGSVITTGEFDWALSNLEPLR
jgi:hypothetical protein